MSHWTDYFYIEFSASLSLSHCIGIKTFFSLRTISSIASIFHSFFFLNQNNTDSDCVTADIRCFCFFASTPFISLALHFSLSILSVRRCIRSPRHESLAFLITAWSCDLWMVQFLISILNGITGQTYINTMPYIERHTVFCCCCAHCTFSC